MVGHENLGLAIMVRIHTSQFYLNLRSYPCSFAFARTALDKRYKALDPCVPANIGIKVLDHEK